KVEFANIQALDPTFSAPAAIDKDGLLVATGSYPTEPDRARFELSYIYEAPRWKLFGIHVIPERAGESAAAPAAADAGGAGPGEKAAPAPDAAASGAYTVIENPNLTGRLGRIIVTFPQGTSPSSTRIEVRPEGGKNTSASNYGGMTSDLLPGTYEVVIS